MKLNVKLNVVDDYIKMFLTTLLIVLTTFSLVGMELNEISKLTDAHPRRTSWSGGFVAGKKRLRPSQRHRTMVPGSM